jgi:hypothetical protein
MRSVECFFCFFALNWLVLPTVITLHSAVFGVRVDYCLDQFSVDILSQ